MQMLPNPGRHQRAQHVVDVAQGRRNNTLLLYIPLISKMVDDICKQFIRRFSQHGDKANLPMQRTANREQSQENACPPPRGGTHENAAPQERDI